MWLETMESCHKLSKNCSINGKNCEISGQYNFWTSIKNNIPDVWNWNCWTFFGFGSWSGGGAWPPWPPYWLRPCYHWSFISCNLSEYLYFIKWKHLKNHVESSKYPFLSGMEIFSFQPEVKGTCISKKKLTPAWNSPRLRVTCLLEKIFLNTICLFSFSR